MRKIYKFQEFVNEKLITEKMGVSPTFPYAAEIVDIISKELMDRYARNQKRFQFTVNLDKDDIKTESSFPAKKIIVQFSSDIDMEVERVYAQGSFNPEHIKIEKDGSVLFAIQIDLHLTLTDMKQYVSSEKIRKAINTEIESTVSHELTHVYEDYMRKNNKKLNVTMKDTKEFLFDAVSKTFISRFPLPPGINQFMYNIYASASYEVNARVAQTYALVKEIKDPHKRWDIIKASPIYKIADDMETFDAQKTYDETIKLLGTKLDDKQIQEWMENCFETFVKFLHQLNVQFEEEAIGNLLNSFAYGEDPGKATQIVKLVQSHDQLIGKDIGHKDFLQYMKKWEKKFHAAGKSMKLRMSKLTMLDIE
jgi:hypothetical protein